MTTSKLYIASGQGENYNYSQDHCFIKLSSRDTNGELCLIEDTLKPGFHLKRHHHKRMTEVFYMLQGEMELTFDDETIILSPGDTITVPPNVWHEAKCQNGGKMLTIFKNGRFDMFLEQLSTMTEAEFSNEELMKSFSESLTSTKNKVIHIILKTASRLNTVLKENFTNLNLHR